MKTPRQEWVFAFVTLAFTAAPLLAAVAVPVADHVVVVVMENHGYDAVRAAPYTAGLIEAGSSFSDSQGLTHPSQPNYLALWAGDTMGVGDDACPPAGSPYAAENLGHACEANGIAWRAYCENLPGAGYAGCGWDSSLYVRRHCPWTEFDNLDHLNERPYADLAADIANGELPRLAFIIPNDCNNTHDCSVLTGDTWLSKNIPPLLAAIGPTGLLILTWDEDDGSATNHILTVFVGGQVRANYVSSQDINHYTVVRVICEALELPLIGLAAFQPPVEGVWLAPTRDGVQDGTASGLGTFGPNPSSGDVTVNLRLGSAALSVQAVVFDAAGQRIATLLDGWRAGSVNLRWDGRSNAGRAVSGGVYFLRISTGNQVEIKKLVRAR